MQNNWKETRFSYVQCNLSVPDELNAKFSNFSPIFSKYWSYQKRYWGIYEDICWRKRFVEATATNVHIEFQVNQRNTYHTTFQLLLGSRTTVYKNSSICTIKTEWSFQKIFQSIVAAWRAGVENPLSGVAAETMKLLGEIFQIHLVQLGKKKFVFW